MKNVRLLKESRWHLHYNVTWTSELNHQLLCIYCSFTFIVNWHAVECYGFKPGISIEKVFVITLGQRQMKDEFVSFLQHSCEI